MRNLSLWVLQVLVGAAFLMAGATKLAGAPLMVSNFEAIGLGQWLRYLTGFLEVAAAGMLWTPRYSALGGSILTVVMIGAVATHVLILGGSSSPAIVLGLLSALIAWGRSAQFDELRLWFTELGETPAETF